ncbi:GxxExxY protein [Dysgonomonas sp. GY75]|uniref:GxxExxY protein n=1 Tax=Dysgonomonas sp. GY75 TaxID=2780419 RepID=UPI0018841427|nr:GxxExxY protein [Dysgonomonas sp. GY75]MBF0649684.1 GxxExxY protein [Dysgonomonas sp. GY75]
MIKKESLTGKILGCAYTVHSELGPGLFEKVYEECLFYELSESGLYVEKQVELPVEYKGITLDAGYKLDLLVEDEIILELKSVKELTDLHTAQLLTYMKLSDCEIGFLMNFNVKSLKDGIKRYIL